MKRVMLPTIHWAPPLLGRGGRSVIRGKARREMNGTVSGFNMIILDHIRFDS